MTWRVLRVEGGVRLSPFEAWYGLLIMASHVVGFKGTVYDILV